MAIDGKDAGRPLTSGPGGYNESTSANELLLRSRVKGDAFDRYQLTVGGTEYVGDGTVRPAQSGTYATVLGTPARSELAATYLYDDATTGQSTIAADYAIAAVSGTTVYHRKTASTNVLQTSTNGSTITDKFTFTAGEIITAILPVSATTIIVCTTDVATPVTPSTFMYVYRSNDGGTTFTKVASTAAVIGSSVQLGVGGYVVMWGITYNGTAISIGMYGHKTLSACRYVYRSIDDGVTWTLALDIGANANRHVHAVYSDPTTHHIWVTTGDDNTAGAGNVGGRNVWCSTDNGATFTPYVFLDTDGVTRLQFVGIAAYRGYIYLGEDNPGRGRIYRCLESNPTGTLEVVFDPDMDGTAIAAAGGAGSSPWIAPVYDFGVDTANNVMYVYAPGESAGTYTDRGRFLMTADGVTFTTLVETGTGGVAPSSSVWSIQPGSGSFVFYNGYRIKRKKAYRALGLKSAHYQTFTFTAPGTIANQTEKFSLSAAMLGYSFRVVRVSIFARAAATDGTITATVKSGATTISTVDPSIAANAVTTARYAEATLVKTSMATVFVAELASLLVVDIGGTGTNGSDLTVVIVVEKQAAPVPLK